MASVPGKAVMMVLAVALAACGGGGSSTSPADPPTSSALAAAAPGELLEHIKSLLRARAAQRAASPNADVVLSAGAPQLTLAVTASGDAVAHSNTTVQEAGIDEEDLLKTDGTDVFALDTQPSASEQMRLRVLRRQSDGRIEPLQTLPLPADTSAYPMPRGLHLAAAARRLAVLSESLTPLGGPVPCPVGVECTTPGTLIFAPIALQSRVQLQFADLGSAGATLGTKLTLDGRLVGSRRIGNVLYLVTSHTPILAVDQLPASATTAEREALLASLTTTEVLPALRINDGAPQPLVRDTDCTLQPRNTSLVLTITTITAVDLGSPTLERASRCFAGGTEAIYMSPSNLYLATTRSTYRVLSSGRVAYAAQFTTDIHKFAFNALAVDYAASGSANGHLGWDAQRKPYRMSEHNGDLRVLTFTGETGWAVLDDATSSSAPAPSPATLTILRERATDRSLQVVSTLPNAQRPAPLGKPGEQIYAVRFAGERGYLVTFRRIDPLYVLDLAAAADPRAAGELEAPGFSDYLFPLPNGLLFGVGKDADAQGRLGGVKLALFDVADATQPKLITSQVLGSGGSASALDYSSHGLNLFMRATMARIALPMRLVSSTPGATTQQALHRFEVDTAARTFAVRPPLAAPALAIDDLWGDRSLQIEDTVVYLTRGEVVTAAW